MHQDVSSTSTAAGSLRHLWSGPRRPSIRTKIVLHQILVALMLLTSAAATVLAIGRIDYYFDRNRLASEQMETVVLLSAHMNRYSENIAELLLLGRTELDDFQAARLSLDQGLDDLARLVERELDLIGSNAEGAIEAGERERVHRMRVLFEGIDLTAQRLLFLREQGEQEQAIALFRETVEEGLDADLEEEIAAAIADEEAELRSLQQRTNQLEVRLILLVAGVSLLALAVSALSGVRLGRTLTAAIQEVVAGARAIGEGDLGYRLRDDRPEEFADLARQFNSAAGRLEAQQRSLLDVQAGLEAEIARRTGELEEANARLQRLDHLRMQFLADIGHELRTPLTVLQGEAEVALRTDRPAEDHRETLGRVVHLARQMARLVEDLLFMARAEVGAIRFDMQPLAVQDVLELALLDARVLAESGGTRIEARLSEAPLRTDGDVGRLAQALLIVLDNAVKYSDPGAAVEVDLRREGREAVLRVANHGVTIPKADLPFVFNRFYRGRQEAERSPGAGLGLSIAKWILDTHGGQLHLQSEEGRTTVTFRLPLRS